MTPTYRYRPSIVNDTCVPSGATFLVAVFATAARRKPCGVNQICCIRSTASCGCGCGGGGVAGCGDTAGGAPGTAGRFVGIGTSHESLPLTICMTCFSPENGCPP